MLGIVVVNAALIFPVRNRLLGGGLSGESGHRDVDLKTKEVRAMARTIASPEFVRQLQGFSLTTAEIFYRLPDHPILLQSYVWQDYDLAPRFPALMKFLAFWREKLDGPLHSVRVAHTSLIKPAEIRSVGVEMLLH
jgi:uncharacterized protein Usg